MLVLQAQKVPEKSSRYLTETNQRFAIVGCYQFLMDQGKLQYPNAPKQGILHDHKVVKPLWHKDDVIIHFQTDYGLWFYPGIDQVIA